MISAIVPTIGRLDSLNALLESLATQTCRVDEVIVASADQETCDFIDNARWDAVGLVVRCIGVSPPNAVRQRMAAIEIARGEHLLMLDDDVVLEPDCVQHLLALLETNDDVVAVTADFSNQTWPDPTRIWQLYLRRVLNLERAQWQGRVV
ncbi:MAG TPA: glycosyltransferase family A protein, partial [Pyrinomonadaceae bacterium]|nr:glycosyltransferase family A protein [Pyrinomonadaceae bacterium]